MTINLQDFRFPSHLQLVVCNNKNHNIKLNFPADLINVIIKKFIHQESNSLTACKKLSCIALVNRFCYVLAKKAQAHILEESYRFKLMPIRKIFSSLDFFFKFVKNSNLNKIDLSYSDVGLNEINTLCQLLPKITHLDLNHCFEIDDECVTTIAKCLPNLTMINLNFCLKISSTGMKIIGELKKLQDLDIDSYTKLDLAVVEAIASLPDLVKLNLSYCKKMDNLYLAKIVHQRNKLSVFKLNLTEVDNTGILSIAERLNLETLEISHLDIEISGIQAIAKKSINLTYLDISHCRFIDDQCIRVICEKYSNLKRLKMNSCLKVTNDGIKFIPNLKNLTELYIPYCDLIDENGYEFLNTRCSYLKITPPKPDRSVKSW